jgi:hypothetical protein
MDNAVLSHLISGAIVMGYAVVGLFFGRFWKQSRDRLFLFFSLAFWVLGAQRLGLALAPGPSRTPPSSTWCACSPSS